MVKDLQKNNVSFSIKLFAVLWNNPLPLTSYVLYVSKPALLLCYRQEPCICIEEKLAALYLCWSGADRRSQLQEARHREEQDLKGSRNLKQEKHRPPNLQQRGKGRGCWFHAWNGDDSNFHVKGRKPHKAGEQGWGQASVNLHSTLCSMACVSNLVTYGF